MKLTDCVDVFWGCGAVELPQLEGIAAKWHFIKGLAGNTTPAAALPFSKITACAYSGGYSSGYGDIGNNSGRVVPRIMPPNTIRGFSHFQPSGTGYIGAFYNYAVTAPYKHGNPEDAFHPEIMEHETGRPGYYATTMRGVKCELTVSRQAAHHRYHFPSAGWKLAIDFTNDGLLETATRQDAKNLHMQIVTPDTVQCAVELHGLQWYFCVSCPGAQAFLWEKGCTFEVPGLEARLTLGASPKSMAIASAIIREVADDFDAIVHRADDQWETALSAIEIETASDADRCLFYTSLYHTLIKPGDFSGESFLYDDEDAFVTDLATLWDQYKTQMPLIFTLYPVMSDKIVRTILSYCRAKGWMPHMLLLEKKNDDSEDQQARMLAEHVLVDAAYRGVPMDDADVARCIRQDVLPEHRFSDYKTTGICKDIAHTIDMADGCHAAGVLAHRAGDEKLAAYCNKLSEKWVAAFDEKTGLLRKDSRFYEGDHWNYSFRLMHDMDRRLTLAGGKESYASLLDQFFGFAGQEAKFEGFNNETDMEAPYAYYYADRHDRICEIVSAGTKYMFTEGRGGLPGNNDSGGLSSLYLWNVMGIFPVSGQNLMLIGSPKLEKVRLRLANGHDFHIHKEGQGIYVKKAVLNGKELSSMAFPTDIMMCGGELIILMAEKPA